MLDQPKTLRRLDPTETFDSLDLLQYSFQFKASDSDRVRLARNFVDERLWGIFERGTLQSQICALPFEIALNGHAVKVAGITRVSSYPEARRKGNVSRLLRHSLQQLHEEQTPIALLIPFDIGFYCRFGWEIVSANVDRPFAGIGPLLAQSVLLNVFIGVAEGALEAARGYVNTSARPRVTSCVERAVDDPGIQRQFGELLVSVLAAESLADRALGHLDKAWSEGRVLSEMTRSEAAVVIAAANVLAGDVALDVTSRIFEVTGTRSTSGALALDRYWRNVRVHTLHNPAEYKRRNLGRWYATGNYPEPGHYS